MTYLFKIDLYQTVRYQLFFLSIFISTIGCKSIASKKATRLYSLKSAFTESINIPVSSNADTIIYQPESDAPFCHHITRKEHLKFFHPHMEKPPFRDILIKNSRIPILFVTDEELDTYVYNKSQKGKVFMSLSGYMRKPHKVEMYERYCYNDTVYIINKVFIYRKKQWTYIISENYNWKL